MTTTTISSSQAPLTLTSIEDLARELDERALSARIWSAGDPALAFVVWLIADDDPAIGVVTGEGDLADAFIQALLAWDGDRPRRPPQNGHGAEAPRVEPLADQVNRLANFILEEIPGEPSQDQGAVDTAIRWMRSAKARIEDLEASLGRSLATCHRLAAKVPETRTHARRKM